MGWSGVPCFRSRDHCPILTEEARAFFSLLSEDLKKLERSLAEGSVSLRWSVEAMNLLKKMQIELVALLKKWQLPISFAAEEDWFNQFMQETADLLDLCNSLKCALSGINRYRMVTDLVIQKMVHDDSSACSLSLKDLEFARLEEYGTRSSVRGMKENVSSSSSSTSIGNGNVGRKLNNTSKSIAAVMLAAKATMVSVSLILVSAVVSPIPIDVAGEELVSRSPQLRPFADMLTALMVRFRERVPKPDKEGSRFVLAEHEKVDSAVGDLRAQVVAGEKEKERESFLESIGVVRTSSAELREGVEMFDAVVDEVFDVVIRGRKEMLGIFRDGFLSSSSM